MNKYFLFFCIAFAGMLMPELVQARKVIEPGTSGFGIQTGKHECPRCHKIVGDGDSHLCEVPDRETYRRGSSSDAATDAEAQAIVNSLPGISNTHYTPVDVNAISQGGGEESTQSYSGNSSSDASSNRLLSVKQTKSKKSSKMWKTIGLIAGVFAIGYLLTKRKSGKSASKTPAASKENTSTEIPAIAIETVAEAEIAIPEETENVTVPPVAEKVEIAEEVIEEESSPGQIVEEIKVTEKPVETTATAQFGGTIEGEKSGAMLEGKGSSGITVDNVVEFMGKALRFIISLIIKIISGVFSLVVLILKVIFRILGSLFNIVKEEVEKQKNPTTKI